MTQCVVARGSRLSYFSALSPIRSEHLNLAMRLLGRNRGYSRLGTKGKIKGIKHIKLCLPSVFFTEPVDTTIVCLFVYSYFFLTTHYPTIDYYMFTLKSSAEQRVIENLFF